MHTFINYYIYLYLLTRLLDNTFYYDILSNIIILDFFLNNLYLSDLLIVFISILHFMYYLNFIINKYNYLLYHNSFTYFSYVSLFFLFISIIEDINYELNNSLNLYFLSDIDFFSSFFINNIKIVILLFLVLFFLFEIKNKTLKIINNNGLIYTLLWFLIMSLFFIISTNNLVNILLLLELQTFISLILYFLITNKKYNINEILKLEAGIKYFLMSALGSIFIILGLALIYFLLGTYNFVTIKEILYFKFETINFYFYINLIFIFILLGLFIKLGIVPFHQWTLDIVLGLPFILLFYFFVFPKIAFIILLFKFYSVFCTDYNFTNFEFVIIILIFFNLLLSSINAIFDTRLKRILVFSNISSTATFIISLLLNNNIIFENIMLYTLCSMYLYIIFIYILDLLKLKINIKKNKSYTKFEITNIDQLINIIYIYPIISILLIFIIFSLIGLPPFLGFFFKFNIIFNFTLFSQNIIFIILYFIFTLYISFYYLKIIRSVNITKYQYYYMLYNNIDRKTTYVSIFFLFSNIYISLLIYTYIFINLNLSYYII